MLRRKISEGAPNTQNVFNAANFVIKCLLVVCFCLFSQNVILCKNAPLEASVSMCLGRRGAARRLDRSVSQSVSQSVDRLFATDAVYRLLN